MAHKTLVGGTAYDTKGGRCLVNGTGYSIKKGRTLVDGTGYDISFGHKVAVTITGSGDASYSYAIINGASYSKAASGIEVETGDIITFGVYGSMSQTGTLVVDGRTTVSASENSTETYNWTVPSGVSKVTINLAVSGNNPYTRYATITVTTS